MPRRCQSLAWRILRTVLIIFGPFLLSIALAKSAAVPESAAKFIGFVSGLWMLSSLLLAPALLSGDSSFGSGPADADDGGGGGWNPRPSRPPSAPDGGLPLPDAQQSDERIRDHNRRSRNRLRRRVREPEPDRETRPRAGGSARPARTDMTASA